MIGEILGRDFNHMVSKVVWTSIEAFLATLIAGGLGLVDVNVVEAAVIAAGSGGVTVLLVYARQRLAELNAEPYHPYND